MICYCSDSTSFLLAARTVLRSLQRYTVSLKCSQWENCEFNTALGKGLLEDCGAGVFVLNNMHYYSRETGLDLTLDDDIIL